MKLPAHPDLEQLKRQARELLRAYLAGETSATAEVEAHYRGADRSNFALHHAQLVLARGYGFESWTKLKAHVDGLNAQQLADAVRANDLARVTAMLKRRPELADMQMSYGNEHRPIHFAVMNRLPEMTRLLMEHGAGARHGIHPHRSATTALTIAQERGYDEIVAIIEEAEQRRRKTTSAAADDLTEAIAEGNNERALQMLHAGASLVNGCDRDGWTPLHIAAAVRDPQLVSWLIENGAGVNRKSADGRTPLTLAAAGRRRIDPERFASVASALRNAGAELTLQAAAALGEIEWLRARHAEKPLINPVRWDSGGLLTVAVRHKRPEVLRLLLGFGFHPDERVSSGEGEGIAWTAGQPLYNAVGMGDRELAEILLEHGADPNASVDSAGSCVHSAYSHRQPHMVELLKRYGGVVGADTLAIYRQTDLARQMIADEDSGLFRHQAIWPGRTLAEDLLDFSCSGGDPEIVRMALERIDWPREDQRWAFYVTRAMDFWNHIPWLYSANGDLDRKTYIECFRQVLQRADPNLIGGFGRTALHEAGAMGDHITEEEGVPFAHALLDAGARTDIRDDILRSTPLGWACRWGRAEVVRVLLERGAPLVEPDAEPWAQPRAWAQKMGHTNVLGVLDRFGR